MGITGLNEFLKKKHSHAVQRVHIREYAFKKIVFDISSYIYRYIAIYGKDDNKWLNAFLFLFFQFKTYNIHVIPIFDGKAPPEKQEEKIDRNEQKDKSDSKSLNLAVALDQFKQTGEVTAILTQTMLFLNKKDDNWKNKKSLLAPGKNIQEEKIEIDIKKLQDYVESREKANFSIDSADIDLLKALLTVLKIPFIQAPSEAESLANYLVKVGRADATFSLDSDCLAYQVPMLIKDFDTKTGMFQVVKFSVLCESLELTPDQFTLMCIIMSCDYNRHTKKIKGIGPVTAEKIVKQWITYDNIKKNVKAFQIEDDGLRYDRCVELFSQTYPEFQSFEMLWDFNIDFNQVELFLKDNKLACDMNKIRSLWSPLDIVFE